MEKCIVQNCKRKKETNIGACLMHYKRHKRRGSFELPVREIKKCLLCNSKPIAKGWCRNHYYNWYRHGDPKYTDKIREYNRTTVRSKHGYLRDANGKWRHRNIMEKHIGRTLGRDEIVHHINIDKLDNRVENFYICSRSQHMSIHNQLEKLVAKLIKDGTIGFKDGTYYFN